MRPPCELVVRYVLPTFRSLVARELIKKYNFSQIMVSKKLGMTQAAISYYLYSKRGNKKMEQLGAIPSVRSAASETAQAIAAGNASMTDILLKLCKLCTTLRKEGVICNLHKESVNLPETCNICPTQP